MQILLYQPQIPQNTGNIVRSCSATNTSLLLVPPLGFHLSDRYLKRAGLDYWDGVSVKMIEDFVDFLEKHTHPFYLFSSRGTTLYTEVNYNIDTTLIFGSETTGLPDFVWDKWSNNIVTIPMVSNNRCLNLSNSVNIGLYEAWRQQGFKGSTTQKKEQKKG